MVGPSGHEGRAVVAAAERGGAAVEAEAAALLVRPVAVEAGRAQDRVDVADEVDRRPRPGGRRFRVLRTDRGFRIAGDVPADEEELSAALKVAGARKGDEVEVDGELLELQ